MDLSLDRWKNLSPPDREETARQLVRNLPSGFEFVSVRCLASAPGGIAFFTFEAAEFALIPGGLFNLGYDEQRDWQPTLEELESWKRTSQDYGVPGSIHEHMARVTLRPRKVKFAPFLVETSAQEMGWVNISPEDNDVKEILEKHEDRRKIELCRGDLSTRVERKADGSIIAQRSLMMTHAELVEQFGAAGFRFPTSDEWEYVCGCGAQTLFRWGDHAPCNLYPTDKSLKAVEFGRQWVASGGKLKPPREAFTRDWDLHVKPNGFGISIASNPYFCELVAEIGTTRGGDGGCTICGGYDFFVGWLTLATSYFEEHACKQDPEEPISAGYTIGRRVFDLR